MSEELGRNLEENVQRSLAMLRVILGAAWADGSLQPEELPALKQVVIDLGLADHPDIRQLVNTPVSPEDYRRDFQAYLDQYPSAEERQYLLDTVTKVIYADDEVSVEEAYVLDELRTILTRVSDSESESDSQAQLRFGEFQALFSRLLSNVKST